MRSARILTAVLLWTALLCINTLASEARDITRTATITADGINVSRITDGNLSTTAGGEKLTLTVEADEEIGGIYLRFRNTPTAGTINDDIAIPENLLAVYTDLSHTLKNSASIYLENAQICELTVYSEGELPRDVQVWRTDNTDTDILLLATHSDDDQLFFAGLLPYYSRLENARVRVAYFVSHSDAPSRLHELLAGLWECGVKYYPEIGIFPDAYSESLTGAKQNLAYSGIPYSDVIDYQRYLLEKYRPQVVVLHDFAGEYGHGQHILNTQSFIDALETAAGDEYTPKKVYVHLLEEKRIELPIDEPLAEFGGLSAFQVSQNAFRHHKSQHWTWFYGWIYGKGKQITTSDEIKTYSPKYYGLYSTSVGADTTGCDMLENITLCYDTEKARLEEEERLLRQEREQAENERRENLRIFKETLLKAASIKEESLQETENDGKGFSAVSVFLLLLAAVAVVIIVFTVKNKRKRDRK